MKSYPLVRDSTLLNVCHIFYRLIIPNYFILYSLILLTENPRLTVYLE